MVPASVTGQGTRVTRFVLVSILLAAVGFFGANRPIDVSPFRGTLLVGTGLGDASPLGGARLRLVPSSDARAIVFKTDRAGRFSARLPRGTYRVEILSPTFKGLDGKPYLLKPYPELISIVAGPTNDMHFVIQLPT